MFFLRYATLISEIRRGGCSVLTAFWESFLFQTLLMIQGHPRIRCIFKLISMVLGIYFAEERQSKKEKHSCFFLL